MTAPPIVTGQRPKLEDRHDGEDPARREYVTGLTHNLDVRLSLTQRLRAIELAWLHDEFQGVQRKLSCSWRLP
jgi:hypothetical protein